MLVLIMMCALCKTKTIILAKKNKEWTGKTFHSQHIILIVANQLLLHSQHIILIVHKAIENSDE
jgi:hypothetical protein